MRLHVLDEEGLPPRGIEKTLARYLLRRQNSLGKRVVYALQDSPKSDAEIVALTATPIKKDLTKVLARLLDEAIVIRVIRTGPPYVTAYALTQLGRLVCHWMRHFEAPDVAAREH